MLARLAPPQDRADTLAEFWAQARTKTASSAAGAVASSATAAAATDRGHEEAADAACEPSGEAGPHAGEAAVVARRFWQERRLRQWVRGVNETAGLTPTTAHVWAVHQGFQDQSADPREALRQVGCASTRRARQWVRRWRRRWQLVLQAPTPGAGLPRQTLRAKAGRSVARSGGRRTVRRWRENGTPKWGSFFVATLFCFWLR